MKYGVNPSVSPTHAWTGSRYIDTANPDPEDINLREIATGLSREARYGGAATSVFWSVGQHSLLQVGLMREDGHDDPALLRAALMHDAPEYMLRDMISPVKRQLPGYKEIESRWWAAMCTKWDLPLVLPDLVKKYDLITMGVEKAGLIAENCGQWPGVPIIKGRRIKNHLLFAPMSDVSGEFLYTAKQLGVESRDDVRRRTQ